MGRGEYGKGKIGERRKGKKGKIGKDKAGRQRMNDVRVGQPSVFVRSRIIHFHHNLEKYLSDHHRVWKFRLTFLWNNDLKNATRRYKDV
jgi:hypothetical protein